MISRPFLVGDADKLVPMSFCAKCSINDDGSIVVNKKYNSRSDAMPLFDQTHSTLKVQCNGIPRFMPKYAPSRDSMKEYIRNYAMELMFASEWIRLNADKLEAAINLQLNKRLLS